jgi:hypothetical protein
MDKPAINKKEGKTSISFFTLDDNVEEMVRSEISEVFNHNKNMNIEDNTKDMVYTCVKELMVNASKTNIKKTFFIEAKIDEADKPLYHSAIKNMKKLMRENYMAYIREKLKKYNHNVEVSIEEKDKGIVIVVKNPLSLLEEEEKNIRETLKQAMEDDTSDIALYYNDSDENKEGAGLGLFLIVNILKDMKIHPSYFRIGVVNDNTIARIEIPLSQDYVGVREI